MKKSLCPFKLVCGTATIGMAALYGDIQCGDIQSAEQLIATAEPTIYVETSLGDIVDKIMILRIKQERIKDQEKLRNIGIELDLLCRAYQASVVPTRELDTLSMNLLEVDKNLWDLEDAVRLKEREKCFDQEFVHLVDSIVINNDERARIKRTINLLGWSRIIEEKSYEDTVETDILGWADLIEEKSYDQIIEIGTENTRQGQSCRPVSLFIALALGDLVDRITILLIKKDRITDPIKLSNIITEYQTLKETLDKVVAPSAQFDSLFHDLLEANSTMWDIQNKLRVKKQLDQFDEEFIEHGRLVYYTNDKRCAAKRQINLFFGSQLIEEKDYTKY